MNKIIFTILICFCFCFPAHLDWEPTLGFSPEPEITLTEEQILFEQTVELIKKYETLHQPQHYPLVGYGHKVLKGESFPVLPLDSVTSDSLLRIDLLKNCAVFRSFGSDSLLLGALAYNVGSTRIRNSDLVRQLQAGNRDIYNQYISYSHYKGKIVKSIQNRRKEEFELLFKK